MNPHINNLIDLRIKGGEYSLYHNNGITICMEVAYCNIFSETLYIKRNNTSHMEG